MKINVIFAAIKIHSLSKLVIQYLEKVKNFLQIKHSIFIFVWIYCINN
jgi:hypothetical protein